MTCIQTLTRNVLIATVTLFAVSAQAAQVAFSAFTEKVERNEFCYLQINEPLFLETPETTATMKKFIASANAARKNQVKELRAEYADLVADPESCKDYQSAIQIDFSFEIQTAFDAKIVSILYSDARYTGGAHGMRVLSAETFNSQTGEVYSDLSAFIRENQLAPLKEKILEALKMEEDFDPGFGFEAWSRETTSVSQISNFYFTPNGIAIFYQEYQVGPYSSGNVTAHLSWEDLKTLGFKSR